ncbi:glycerol-3-phosphate dehydrogenase [Cnuella takakiae]|uniref:Glycerol-3-phosphate dehydrogenase n=1 Tax=Cnuella takakiae TaxID=1302690 RepID=A0A1M5BXL6_9BACT|nr:glycerol-3-phosphate dehydrogenase/oxidase [Cnuella takakiae]OLY93551.1 FAD-dependent oxidoreductase [Cnuella takakiae]SHF47268.1 glycerol-3-phosphate dehydrogenase [Cnuella takakiae]
MPLPANEKPFFNRSHSLSQLAQTPLWDLVVIGGGATGLGVAVDAASRGLRTLLLEGSDFAKGTSSRSTKLVHGGVRYLAQGNIKLVFEALRERGYLLRNAPHLVRRQSFVIPCYNYFEQMKYWTGLKLYDWLSVGLSFGASKLLTAAEVTERLPGVRTQGLTGGILYYDGRFDDARLALNLAQTAAREGATVLNYMQVQGLLKSDRKISGVIATDLETGTSYELYAKAVVNATGVFVDEVLQLDEPGRAPLVRPSQGIHLVFDRSFLPGETALMIPQTSDGRVLFALPWHGQLLVGTTDTPLNRHALEPVAQEAEIGFVLDNVQRYLARKPQRSDIKSIFAGLRPLAAPHHAEAATKEISRDHKLLVAPSGLITITGGKWTTYRKMAEDVLAQVEVLAGLTPGTCRTRELPIHGAGAVPPTGALQLYGSDAAHIEALVQQYPELGKPLLTGHAYLKAEVVWAIQNEMARTVEDVLARRLRLLFLDARAALAAAPGVAQLMAAELGKDKEWVLLQVQQFEQVAGRYLPQESATEVVT